MAPVKRGLTTVPSAFWATVVLPSARSSKGLTRQVSRLCIGSRVVAGRGFVEEVTEKRAAC